MSGLSIQIPNLSEASIEEKLALIDVLWKSVRRSAQIEVRDDHLEVLNRRLVAVNDDSSIALSPSQARALLRQ